MKKQQVTLTKKKLALAMSLAMVGTISGCSSSSSGGGGDNTSGGDSIFTILLNGGIGGNVNTAEGGDGGEFMVTNGGASGGIKMQEKGSAKTKFDTPVKPDDPELGSNPLAITVNTTLLSVNDDNPLADGAGALAIDDLYLGDDDVVRQSVAGGVANFGSDTVLATGSAYIRVSDRSIGIVDTATAATHSTATGLSIATGVTLTLGDYSGTNATVEVINDIENNGTITKVANGGNLELRSNTYFGGDITNAGTEDNEDAGRITVNTATGINNEGTINASGFDEDDESGGNGDRVSLNAGGYIINNGMIDASGGDGSGAAGDGDDVDMSAAYVENNGVIDGSGGANTSDPFVAGDGGDGGEIELESSFGTYSTAAIDVSGGDGSQGGNGGEIELYTYEAGDVRSSGASALSGGVGSADAGGNGGEFFINSRGGDALSSGDVIGMGGNSIFADAFGGNGGEINFGSSNGGEGAIPPGDVVVSGNLNVSGGNVLLDTEGNGTGTGDGGDGGEINIDLSMQDVYEDQRITLLGYMSIDSNGGDGSVGGDGSEVMQLSAQSRLNQIDQEYTVGSVSNEVAINAMGGHSTAVDPEVGRGGRGGNVYMRTNTNDELLELKAEVTNEGAINVTGGHATGGTGSGTRGGDGGEFNLRAFHNIENKGAVTSTGGNGGEVGGGGGFIIVTSVQAEAKNSADLTLGGGDGAEDGGFGGMVLMTGESNNNSGDILANGGNATDDAATSPDAEGGDGGEVSLVGRGLDSDKNSGDVSLLPGTGVEDGEAGCLQVGITFEGNCI